MQSYKFILSIILAILVGSCDRRPVNEEILDKVNKTDFGVDVYLLETRGEYYTNRWFPIVLYFGYANDGNMRWCSDEADRLNKQEKQVKYRCVVASKSKG